MSSLPETEFSYSPSEATPESQDAGERLEYALGVFVNEFRTNALRNLDRIEEILSAAPGNEADGPTVNSVLAILANIEGQGRSFDFELISELGEMTCGYLRGLKSANSKEVALIGKVVEAMRLVLQQDARGEGGLTERALVACLREAFAEADE